MPEETILSLEFPQLVVHIDLVGHFSLVGALAKAFIEKDFIKHIGVLKPTEIVFRINKVHAGVDVYKEVNLVRDIFKIDETKITVFIL